ncbi:unnamed protein product [Brachionus calyciflorus]|uniref:Uncharacterized protein n=1 Tax=Brachionus calyciflorus TaxID=104777 RepID=A0A814SNN6_9BILA|nr:unnamed protein product [Brachionus calyciflorus]
MHSVSANMQQQTANQTLFRNYSNNQPIHNQFTLQPTLYIQQQMTDPQTVDVPFDHQFTYQPIVTLPIHQQIIHPQTVDFPFDDQFTYQPIVNLHIQQLLSHSQTIFPHNENLPQTQNGLMQQHQQPLNPLHLCRCGSDKHTRTNHRTCPLNSNENRSSFHLMARPVTYDLRNIVGKGIERNPQSPNFGRHLLRNEKLICNNCHAIMFFEEKTSGTVENPSFSMCCSNKQFKLPTNNPLPPLLMNLIRQQNALGEHFVQNIRSFNSVFAFTSFNGHWFD